MKTRIARAASIVVNHYYRTINRDKPRLLIYTDSRGFNVIGKRGKVPHESYIDKLQTHYHVHYLICPEKYTTIVDFINYVQKINLKAFDAVIMHCGVVDFSPRPLSNINVFKKSKANTPQFNELFISNEPYYQQPFETTYYDEKTVNIYSKEYLSNTIIPQLKKIPNLIWINSNHFVPGWEGNYTKGRPGNIDNVVSGFDQLIGQALTNVINLKKWKENEIKQYTIDNIHFTSKGFDCLYTLLNERIKKVILTK